MRKPRPPWWPNPTYLGWLNPTHLLRPTPNEVEPNPPVEVDPTPSEALSTQPEDAHPSSEEQPTTMHVIDDDDLWTKVTELEELIDKAPLVAENNESGDINWELEVEGDKSDSSKTRVDVDQKPSVNEDIVYDRWVENSPITDDDDENKVKLPEYWRIWFCTGTNAWIIISIYVCLKELC